jgi:hypothetical protein
MQHEFTIWAEGESGSEHEFFVIADCDVVDNGIGATEFWGIRSYHVQLQNECELVEAYLVGRNERKRKLDLNKLSCYMPILNGVKEKFEELVEDAKLEAQLNKAS